MGSVPLAAELDAALDELRDASPFTADDDLVFAGRAGVRVVRFRDLRHTFGTRVARLARNLREAVERLDPV